MPHLENYDDNPGNTAARTLHIARLHMAERFVGLHSSNDEDDPDEVFNEIL